MWAIAVNEKEDAIVSGGADGVMNVWQDYTLIEEEEEMRLEEDRIEKYVQQTK